METLPIIGISMWVIVKSFALVLLGMYLIFGLVVVKQVKMMTTTLQLGFEAPIIMLGYIHLVSAILVFLAALIIL
jgi:hypothetical protein